MIVQRKTGNSCRRGSKKEMLLMKQQISQGIRRLLNVVTSCPVSRKQSSWLQLGSDIRRCLSLISLHITAYSAQGATLPAQRWQCFSTIIWPFRRWEGRWNDEHGDSRTGWQGRTHTIRSPLPQRSCKTGRHSSPLGSSAHHHLPKKQHPSLRHVASTRTRESHLRNISTHFQSVSFKSDAGMEPRHRHLGPRPVLNSQGLFPRGHFNWFSRYDLLNSHEVTTL